MTLLSYAVFFKDDLFEKKIFQECYQSKKMVLVQIKTVSIDLDPNCLHRLTEVITIAY